MVSYENITRWLHIIVATIAVWSQGYVESMFKKLNASNYYLVGVFVLAVAGMQVSDWLAVTVINKVRWVRRLLSGRNDIEGDWVNIVVRTATPEEVVGAEYCRIRYEHGAYVLSGDTWTLDGKWVHSFCTGGSSYQGRQLEYYYKTGINRVGGFGVISFTPDDSLPTEFICHYIDEEVQIPHATWGRRISKNLRRVSLNERREAALSFACECQTNALIDLTAALGHHQGARDSLPGAV